VVTGSNKGIGFGIVRALCKQFDGDVILTARDESRGKASVKALEKEGLKPLFHQLDICDHDSIVRLRDFLQEKYGGLDVLVNNAGIVYNSSSNASFKEQAVETNKINYFSTLDACEVLFPLLKAHARVCNMSSGLSKSSLSKCSSQLQKKFTDPNLSMEELTTLIKKFIEDAGKGDHVKSGFSDSAYGMSKVGVTVMTIIQQRELDKKGNEDIVVNSCCPGYVNTDLTNGKGTLTIDQGAVTPVYCALLPANCSDPRGKFLQNKKVTPWKI